MMNITANSLMVPIFAISSVRKYGIRLKANKRAKEPFNIKKLIDEKTKIFVIPIIKKIERIDLEFNLTSL
jgi:hypothetical protein